MALLPDAAKLSPERLARRWFTYAVCGVVTIVAAVTLLLSTTSGPPAASHQQARVGEVDPRSR